MKNVFLTGASSGIGRATAELLTERGYQVWGTSRSLAKLPELKNFHPVKLDLAMIDSLESTFREAEAAAGYFDILINNAGEGILGPLEAFTAPDFRAQLEVLVLGPHELIRLVLPSMRQRNQGTILNISSLAARFPVPFLGPYSAAKAALANYTETLRLELSGTRIGIIDLQPGDFDTSFAAGTRTLASATALAYRPQQETATQIMNQHMAQGPKPKSAAQAVLNILEGRSGGSPRTIGTFYQATFSPWLARVLPKNILEKGLRDYYKLP